MGEWRTVLLTLVVSVITAWITSKIAFKSDIKKYLHSKREVLYLEFYEELDKFLMDTSLVYDKGYWNRFLSFKPKLKLIASKNVINEYKAIHMLFKKFDSMLEEFDSKNNPERDDNNYFQTGEYEGEPYESLYGDPDIYIEYRSEYQAFKREMIPSVKDVQALVDNITDAMRKDLGSKQITMDALKNKFNL